MLILDIRRLTAMSALLDRAREEVFDYDLNLLVERAVLRSRHAY